MLYDLTLFTCVKIYKSRGQDAGEALVCVLLFVKKGY